MTHKPAQVQAAGHHDQEPGHGQAAGQPDCRPMQQNDDACHGSASRRQPASRPASQSARRRSKTMIFIRRPTPESAQGQAAGHHERPETQRATP